MRVILSAAARADLIEVGDYIRTRNPARAATFVDELIDCCEELANMPRAFPLVPRYEHTGIRRRSYRGYLIFYRFHADAIEILHVLHGAQDYEPLLFPE